MCVMALLLGSKRLAVGGPMILEVWCVMRVCSYWRQSAQIMNCHDR